MTDHQSATNSDGGVPSPAGRDKDHDKIRRHRTGFVLLILGFGLVLWAWGNWYYRISNPDEISVKMIRDD